MFTTFLNRKIENYPDSGFKYYFKIWLSRLNVIVPMIEQVHSYSHQSKSPRSSAHSIRKQWSSKRKIEKEKPHKMSWKTPKNPWSVTKWMHEITMATRPTQETDTQFVIVVVTKKDDDDNWIEWNKLNENAYSVKTNPTTTQPSSPNQWNTTKRNSSWHPKVFDWNSQIIYLPSERYHLFEYTDKSITVLFFSTVLRN